MISTLLSICTPLAHICLDPQFMVKRVSYSQPPAYHSEGDTLAMLVQVLHRAPLYLKVINYSSCLSCIGFNYLFKQNVCTITILNISLQFLTVFIVRKSGGSLTARRPVLDLRPESHDVAGDEDKAASSKFFFYLMKWYFLKSIALMLHKYPL